jgi:hypothetical protein
MKRGCQKASSAPKNERREKPPLKDPRVSSLIDNLLAQDWPALPPEVLRQLRAEGYLPPDQAERYLAGNRARTAQQRAAANTRCDLVQQILFGGNLPAGRRKRPYSKETKKLVRDELGQRGIEVSERTLERYYARLFYLDPDRGHDACDC